MTTTRPGISPDLIFENDGHVTDLCVTCVADGELDLVPRAALDHLDACDACGRKLGEAALLSVATGEALRASPAPLTASIAPVSPRRSRRPVPFVAIAAALVVAVITAGPTLAETVAGGPGWVAGAARWIPTLLRVAGSLLFGDRAALGPWALGLKVISAVMFVLMGLQVARVTSQRRAAQIEGGGR